MGSGGEKIRRIGMARAMPALVLVFRTLVGLVLSAPPNEAGPLISGFRTSYDPETLNFDLAAIVPRVLESVEQLCDERIELRLWRGQSRRSHLSSDAPREEYEVSLKAGDREAVRRCLFQIERAVRNLSVEAAVAQTMSDGISSNREHTKSSNQSHANQQRPKDCFYGKTVFLGGLTAGTTEEMIGIHFGKWGALHNLVLMRDEIDRKSRGLGFVEFMKSDSADAALDEEEHVIDGRAIAFHRAVSADLQPRPGTAIDIHQRSGIRGAAAAASPMDPLAAPPWLPGNDCQLIKMPIPNTLAFRLNQNFQDRTWRCCDSQVDVHVDSLEGRNTSAVMLQGHDKGAVERCHTMMAQLISEEASNGGDMNSTDKIQHGAGEGDVRPIVVDVWRMCGAQDNGRAESRGDGPGGGGAITFGINMAKPGSPGVTKYLPISNEELVFITGEGEQLIKEIQKHVLVFVQVHLPLADQIPEPITTAGDDIGERHGVAMSFNGKTEDISDFALTRMRAQLYQRANEIEGLYSAGSTMNPVLYVDVPDEQLDLLIGSRGSTIEGLRTQTGCRIDIPARGSRESKIRRVIIIGVGDSPRVTKNMIDTLVNGEDAAHMAEEVGGERRRLDSSGGGGAGVEDHELEIEVPAEVIDLIVGRRASMQHDHEVTLQIPGDDDLAAHSDVHPVKLKGKFQSVERCVSEINQIRENAAAGRKAMGYLAIPENKLGIVIGRGGETIAGVRKRTGVTIQIPVTPDVHDSTMRTCMFSAATTDEVDRAMGEVLGILRSDAAREEGPSATSPKSLARSARDGAG